MATLSAAHHAESEPDLGSDRLAVLNIQRTCVHDGPGIRTTVFFRGCPLRCKWCQNPETQAFASASTRESGLSVADIQSVIAKDREYYRNTHGGVTLSGGEPLAQNQAGLLRLLADLKNEGLHVTVETAGDVPWRVFEACLPYVDLFLFDVKVVGDEALHQQLTNRDGRRIEANLRRLVDSGAEIRVRMCVVPGHNDTLSNIEATATLLKSIGHSTIELMRYYDLHETKARRLDLPQKPLHITAERSAHAVEAALGAFNSLGIAAHTTATEATRRRATFTPRVTQIHKDIRDADYAVCLESAELKTAYHKKHGFTGPLPVRRADLLRYLLNKKKIAVYPSELLVGNFTSKRVGGSVWVEYFGAAMALTLWNINRQTPIGFKCSAHEKLRFYTQMVPFWATRSLFTKVFPSLGAVSKYLLRTIEKRSGFNNNMAGIAHYIVNCERLVTLGTTGIAKEAEEKRKGNANTDFYDGVIVALKALEEFADRYAEQLHMLARDEADPDRRDELERMADVCSHVPRNPARTFHEALQAILFLQIALCTESFENAISLGRLDQVLYPYYEADVAAGRIDYEAAKELMACFILKIDEVIFLNDGESLFELGKMFESLSPVETVTVGGVDREGNDCTNDVSYMVLDTCELRPIGVNMAARIHHDSPAEYVERIAEVYLNGSPMPALFNDDVYVAALRNEYETTVEDARSYAIVGCVEPCASDDHFGNTDASNINLTMPFLQALRGDTRRLWGLGELSHLDERVRRGLRERLGRSKVTQRALIQLGRARKRIEKRLSNGRNRPSASVPASISELMERFQERLTELVHDVLADQQRIETALSQHLTTPLASSLYRGCMESGKDVYEGGTTFNTSGIQAVGVTDVADSLAALDELVFRQQRYSLTQVLEAMDDNFQGQHHEQLHCDLLAIPKFGDDAATHAHEWVHRVLEVYLNALHSAEHKNRNGKYVAGYYGLNVNMMYGRKTPALPSGRLYGVPLANSICPHYGMQMVDLSSALNAVAKVDFARFAPNGTTLTSTIDSGLFPGQSGTENLAGLIRGYFNQGGMQFQPNLIDREILLDAYQNPGKHKDLVVRIAGYCAYFDDLSDELKREIINRSYYTH